MQRRLFLLTPIATRLLFADAADQVYDLFTSMATALGASEAGPFMAAFDKAMPEYDKLAGYIQGITSQSDLTTYLDLLSNEGDEKERTVEADWLLQLSVANENTVRRHQTIKCRLRREGKKWKIVSLDPVEFFAPVKPR